jgi:hypothetical protein
VKLLRPITATATATAIGVLSLLLPVTAPEGEVLLRHRRVLRITLPTAAAAAAAAATTTTTTAASVWRHGCKIDFPLRTPFMGGVAIAYGHGRALLLAAAATHPSTIEQVGNIEFLWETI